MGIKIPSTDSTYEIDGALTVTGLITATGGVTGTASVATTVATAATTDSTCSVALLESATGNQGIKSDAGLTYDATANVLTANVTGTASLATNVNATSTTSATGRMAVLATVTGGSQPVQYTDNLIVSPSNGNITATGLITAGNFSGRLGLREFYLTSEASTASPGLTISGSTQAGKMFFTRGAAAQIITLPAVASSANFSFTFFSKTDQNLTITCPANTLITKGNAGATSVEFKTTGEKIGACVNMFCDGTNWYATNNSDCTMDVIT